MANRFESPIASEFINTYVPIPFKEMMAAGQMKQQRYDQGAAAQDAVVQRLEMLNAVPGSPDEAYKKEALQKMYDIRDKYVGKDLGDSFVLRQMNNDINTGIDKPRLQNAELNFVSWKEAEKGKRELASKNLYNPLLDEDKPELYDATKGVRNYVQKAYIDKNEMFSPYFKDVQNDFNYIENGKDGYAREVYGVSDKKIREQLSNAKSLAGTAMGQSYVAQWRKLNPGVDKDPVKILEDEMYDVGKAFVKTEKRTLGASLQKYGDGPDGLQGGDNSLNTTEGNIPNVEGDTPREKIKNIKKGMEVNVENAVNADPGTEEGSRLIGLVNRDKQDVEQAKTTARTKYASDITKVKKEAFDKLRALPELSKLSSDDINGLIEHRFDSGFVGKWKRANDWSEEAFRNVTGALPSHIGGFLYNIVNKVGAGMGPAGAEAHKKAMADFPEKWEIGDALDVVFKEIGYTGEGSSVNMSSKISGVRNKNARSVLREVTKQVGDVESKITSEADNSLLKQRDYGVSAIATYPIVTQKVGDNEYIIPPDKASGYPGYASNIDRVSKEVWRNFSHFEVRDVDTGKVLEKQKDIDNAKSIASTWTLGGAITNTQQDDKGNLIFRQSFIPKNKEQGTAGKEYEIKVPLGSAEYWRIVDDYRMSNDIPTYTKLSHVALQQEILNHANDAGGHDIKITYPDGAKQNVKIEYDATKSKYVATTYKKGKLSDDSQDFATIKELKNGIFNLQLAASTQR